MHNREAAAALAHFLLPAYVKLITLDLIGKINEKTEADPLFQEGCLRNKEFTYHGLIPYFIRGIIGACLLFVGYYTMFVLS